MSDRYSSWWRWPLYFYMKRFFLTAMLCYPLITTAQLEVTLIPPKIIGQKATVLLKMRNNLSEAVESARAVCFLMDDQGKMVGHGTKWVVGQNKQELEPKSETTFDFVITGTQPFTTTNLTAKVSVSRIVLAGGKLINPDKDVIISNLSR